MRYARQEIFIGKEAQEQLEKSTATIVGIGALGTVVAELLARSGVNIKLVDRDCIDETNLHRQVLFSEKDKGKTKVQCAKEKLKEINTQIKIEDYFVHLDGENISILKADIIIDCTDNLETRYLLNEYAVKKNIPLVHGSAIQDHGFVFNILKKPCLQCVLKEAKTIETCEIVGVLNTITHMIGALQAQEAIKILTKRVPEKDLLYVTLKNNEITKIKVNPNAHCPVCKGRYTYLDRTNHSVGAYCGAYIWKREVDTMIKKSLIEKGGTKIQNVIIFKNITIFPNTVLIKTKTEKEARSLYSKYIGN